ncbi:LRRC74A [Scenedesmus sp. PABB004]|nr:LRRC74A [Scenedesmus sp. PABB004]
MGAAADVQAPRAGGRRAAPAAPRERPRSRSKGRPASAAARVKAELAVLAAAGNEQLWSLRPAVCAASVDAGRALQAQVLDELQQLELLQQQVGLTYSAARAAAAHQREPAVAAAGSQATASPVVPPAPAAPADQPGCVGSWAEALGCVDDGGLEARAARELRDMHSWLSDQEMRLTLPSVAARYSNAAVAARVSTLNWELQGLAQRRAACEAALAELRAAPGSPQPLQRRQSFADWAAAADGAPRGGAERSGAGDGAAVGDGGSDARRGSDGSDEEAEDVAAAAAAAEGYVGSGLGGRASARRSVPRSSDVLQLSHSGLRPQQLGRVAAALVAAPWVTRLDLSGNALTDGAVAELAGMLAASPGTPGVTSLSLSRNPLTWRCAPSLAQLLGGGGGGLRCLALEGVALGDRGAAVLAPALAASRHLSKLSLTCAELSDAGGAALCAAGAALVELDLGWNALGRETARAVAAALGSPGCRLSRLGLSRCGLDDTAGAAVLDALLPGEPGLTGACAPWRCVDLSDNALEGGAALCAAAVVAAHASRRHDRLPGDGAGGKGPASCGAGGLRAPRRSLLLGGNPLGASGVRCIMRTLGGLPGAALAAAGRGLGCAGEQPGGLEAGSLGAAGSAAEQGGGAALPAVDVAIPRVALLARERGFRSGMRDGRHASALSPQVPSLLDAVAAPPGGRGRAGGAGGGGEAGAAAALVVTEAAAGFDLACPAGQYRLALAHPATKHLLGQLLALRAALQALQADVAAQQQQWQQERSGAAAAVAAAAAVTAAAVTAAAAGDAPQPGPAGEPAGGSGRVARTSSTAASAAAPPASAASRPATPPTPPRPGSAPARRRAPPACPVDVPALAELRLDGKAVKLEQLLAPEAAGAAADGAPAPAGARRPKQARQLEFTVRAAAVLVGAEPPLLPAGLLRWALGAMAGHAEVWKLQLLELLLPDWLLLPWQAVELLGAFDRELGAEEQLSAAGLLWAHLAQPMEFWDAVLPVSLTPHQQRRFRDMLGPQLVCLDRRNLTGPYALHLGCAVHRAVAARLQAAALQDGATAEYYLSWRNAALNGAPLRDDAVPDPGCPPAPPDDLRRLLGDLRRLHAAYDRHLLELRREFWPGGLRRACGDGGQAAAAAAARPTRPGGHEALAAAEAAPRQPAPPGGGTPWWAASGLDASALLLRHQSATELPLPGRSRPGSSRPGSRPASSRGLSRRSTRSTAPRPGTAASAGSAGTASAGGGGTTDEQLLACLLGAPEPRGAAATFACLGQRRVVGVLGLLGGMPQGPAAVAAMLGCLSPVVAARLVHGVADQAPLLPAALRCAALPLLAPAVAESLREVAAAMGRAAALRDVQQLLLVRRFAAAVPGLSCDQLGAVLRALRAPGGAAGGTRCGAAVALWARVVDRRALVQVFAGLAPGEQLALMACLGSYHVWAALRAPAGLHWRLDLTVPEQRDVAREVIREAVRASLAERARSGSRVRQLLRLRASGKEVADPEDDKLWLSLESKHSDLEFDYAPTQEQGLLAQQRAAARILAAWRRRRARRAAGSRPATPGAAAEGAGGLPPAPAPCRAPPPPATPLGSDSCSFSGASGLDSGGTTSSLSTGGSCASFYTSGSCTPLSAASAVSDGEVPRVLDLHAGLAAQRAALGGSARPTPRLGADASERTRSPPRRRPPPPPPACVMASPTTAQAPPDRTRALPDDSNGEQGGLPRELLAGVLARLPRAGRLRAALACSDWRDAATAATTSIVVKEATQPRADGLAAWLGARGRQVALLEVEALVRATLALPCKALVRLEALRLQGVGLVTPSGVTLAPLAGRLTSLELERCGLPLPVVESRGALTRLRRLELELELDRNAPREHTAALVAALGALTQLTRLTLGGSGLTDEVAATPVSGLAALAELRLAGAGSVPQLPTGLTWLELDGMQLPPATLAACRGLQHLECGLGARGGELLAAVGACTQLEQLTITGLDDEQLLPAAAWAPLAALSGRLTRLEIGDPVRCGAGAHLFPAGCTFSRLEQLAIRFSADFYEHLWAAVQADVDGLAAACPALRELAVGYGGFGSLFAPPPVRLHGLLALTRLTRLHVLDASFDGQDVYLFVSNDQAKTVLAHLTGLRELETGRCCYDLTPAGVLHLTALTGLSSLRVTFCDEDGNLDDDDTCWESEAPDGAPPDVWRQLQAWCDAEWRERERLMARRLRR